MHILTKKGKYTDQVTRLIKQCRDAMRKIVADKKWITATPILVGSESMAQELINLGAQEVLAIGCAEGVRHTTLEEEVLSKLISHCMNLSFEGDMMDGIRGGEIALDHLNEQSLSLITTFDPDLKAYAFRAIFSESEQLAGRHVFGSRPAHWQALEDKIVIDDFWDQAGVKRAPSLCVDLNLESLERAYLKMNQGVGVVIAGDAKAGFHGGATLTRWARSKEQLNLILSDLKLKCDQVRVMPLLEGVSCSMHGWVFPSGEYISLRPCEMLVSFSDQDTRFEYHGASTLWRPSSEIKQEMEQVVERAAQRLSNEYQYRGVFTVDGIATSQGFLPTELNPRFGGALGRMNAALPELPLLTMHYATVEGHDVGISPHELRELMISAAEAKPIVRGMMEIDEPCPQPQTLYFRRQGDRWEQCNTPKDQEDDSTQSHHAQVKWGTAIRGSLLFAFIEPSYLNADMPSIGTVKTILLKAKKCLDLT